MLEGFLLGSGYLLLVLLSGRPIVNDIDLVADDDACMRIV